MRESPVSAGDEVKVSHEEQEPAAFEQRLGVALSKFGRAPSSDTTSAGSQMSKAGDLREAAYDLASSQASGQQEPSLLGKTTVMLKNVPLKYTQRKLLREFLNAGFQGKMDFLYLPMDPRTRCCRGFAFCNFASTSIAQQFYWAFNKKFLKSYHPEEPLEVAAAEIQGFEANAEHYLSVKASRKEKGRDTFGSPFFLRPLPKHLMTEIRQEEELSFDVTEARSRRNWLAPPGPLEPMSVPMAYQLAPPGPLEPMSVPMAYQSRHDEAAPEPGLQGQLAAPLMPFEPKAAPVMPFEPKSLLMPQRPTGGMPGMPRYLPKFGAGAPTLAPGLPPPQGNLRVQECESCGRRIPANAFCPYCGHENQPFPMRIGQPYWI